MDGTISLDVNNVSNLEREREEVGGEGERGGEEGRFGENGKRKRWLVGEGER